MPNIGFIFLLYNNYIYTIFFAISAITLILIKKLNYLKHFNYIILILVIGELFILANLQWAIPTNHYDSNGYNKLSLNPLINLQDSFKANRVSTTVKGNTYFRNLRKFNINYFDNFGVEHHTKLFDKYFDRKGNFRNNVDNETRDKIKFLWALDNNKKKVFFSKSISHKNINALVDDIYSNEDNFNSKIFINFEKFNGDTILIEIDAKEAGYITYMDNWSPGWIATINNKNQIIEKVLKSYKSVKIDKGKNKIIFEYKPW